MAKAKQVEQEGGDQGVAGVTNAVASEVPSFVGSKDGVVVYPLENGVYTVGFGFDRKLMSMMHSVPNAVHDREASDKNAQIFTVPAESVQKLGMVVAQIRDEYVAIEAARNDIVTLATRTAAEMQRENGTSGVQPKVSDYIERATADKPGRAYIGEIVNANTRFAAQLTGFGEKDGAAFVTIHRKSDLDQDLEKGERAKIEYGANGRASVAMLGKTHEQRVADFQASAGKKIEGVTVSELPENAGLAVQFDVNPAMINRIKRIEGAAFDRDRGAWVVGADKAEFVMRAVEDMRSMHVQDQKDIAALTGVANDKLDGAKVSHAFTKEGVSHTGKVVASLGNYVMQKTGPDKFSLHHKDSLDMDRLKPDQNIKVQYGKHGMGKVTDLDLEKSKGQALGGR